MGQALSTNQGLVGSVEALELSSQVCDAAEELAAVKCGKHSVTVFKQVALLRDTLYDWRQVEAQAEGLHGCQVFAVAAALQALTGRLQWYQHKLHSRSRVSLANLTSRQQAAHIIKVLSVAADAHQHFSTAFKLAVLLSKQEAERTLAQQQQHPDHYGQQEAPVTDQGQQQYSQQEAAAAQRQPQAAQEVHQPCSMQHSTDVTHNNTSHGTPAVQQQQQQQDGAQLPLSPQQQPPSTPACPVVATTNIETHAALTDTGSQTLADAAAGPRACMVAAHTPPLEGVALPAALAEGTASEGVDAEEEEQGGGVYDEGPDELHEPEVAGWEHTADGWQALLLQAWRGEQGAVLACAQELIHGGDFCLQDVGLARKLLHTTAHQSCGTACLWLGQLSEHGLGLPAPDYTEAAAWYGRGAAAGDIECAQALAFYYQHGLGLPQDLQAAVEWYQYAADGGLPAAQNNLGQLLLVLHGADGAAAEAYCAVELFQAAADQGSTAAYHNLVL